MIQTALRLVTGLAGALALLLFLRFWMDPAAIGAQLGLTGEGLLGAASLRADVGGFFGAAGAFALAAAIRNDRQLALTPLVLVSLALAGRLYTMAHDGMAPAEVQPAVIEAVLAAVFAGAWRGLGKRG